MLHSRRFVKIGKTARGRSSRRDRGDTLVDRISAVRPDTSESKAVLAATYGVPMLDASFQRERAVDLSPVGRDAPEPSIQALVDQATGGGAADGERLFAALYDELHRLAERQLRRNGAQLTLGATTLLHEAYLALGRSDASFPDRARFMGYVARAMRGLIIDYARRGRAQKRGGGEFEVTLNPEAVPAGAAALELVQLGDALDELAAVQPALAELVDLHFFGGLSFVEIAALRGVSDRTVQRDWRKARVFLHQTLLDDEGAEPAD